MKPPIICCRALAPALVAIAVATLAASGCTRRGPDGVIHASGHIEATDVRLAAKVGGRLLELPLREGDPVAKGQLVARFDTADAELELARLRAEVAAADAQLRLLLAGSREEDLRQAAAQLAVSTAEVAAAERDLGRLAGLADRGAATTKARDDAATRLDVARRSQAALQAVHDKLRAGPRPQEIEAARARRLAIEAAIATVEQRVADATVVAPRDGVITSRAAEPGEVLAPGAPLEILTDLAHPWLTVWVDEPSLAAIRIGGTASVGVDGRPDRRPATVSFVSPVAEFTPKNVQTPDERAKLVFRVNLALDNPEGIFKPGMPADAYFEAGGETGEGRGSRQ